jgi:hypothetical protein
VPEPESKRIISEDVNKRYEKLEERIKMRDIAKSNWEDPQWVENYYIGVYKQGFWYGHPTVHKDSNRKYCEIFEEVKPRVKAFFNNTCIKCGDVQTFGSYHVHHVFYEKKTCCWIDGNGGYWTNLNIKNREKDYYIGENPNYFALLCDSCHGETGGNYNNRKKSADELREIIDKKFSGKSYFTEDEMLELGYIKISKKKWVGSILL